MPLTQSTIFRPPSPHPKPPLRPAPLQRFTPSPLSPANAPSSPERATDYRRGQAMRSPRSRVPQQITPPWGGAGVGTIRHSSFIIGSGVWRLSGGYASLTPVCNLPPPRGFSSSASANPSSSEDMCRAWKSWERSVLWMVARKGMCSGCLALVAFDRIVA